MAIYPNFYQTLLPCPIVELRGYLSACGLKGRLYAYLDFDGPTGTSRDALAEGMLALAAEQHTLAPGQPIIEASTGAFVLLIHPLAVITPVSYTFAQLDQPSALSEGKYVYYEESFEDVFILNKKADAIQINMEASA